MHFVLLLLRTQKASQLSFFLFLCLRVRQKASQLPYVFCLFAFLLLKSAFGRTCRIFLRIFHRNLPWRPVTSTGKISLHSLQNVWNFALREYGMPCALEKILVAEVSDHKQKRMRHPVFAVRLP